MNQAEKLQRPLTKEETSGTKTFHLPFSPNAGQAPEMTIMVKRVEDGTYHLGLAICSTKDAFSRREGRARAYEKLRFAQYVKERCHANPTELVAYLHTQVLAVNVHFPLTLSLDTIVDLDNLLTLDQAFDKLDANREARSAKVD